MTNSAWYKAKVKAVPSGDCVVVVSVAANAKPGLPPEKSITLSSLIAPRLARRGGLDEPFAWQSREFLRKLLIGKEITFRIDYTLPSIAREFGTVFLGDKNVALLVVSQGWAKVSEQGQQKGEASPFLAELLRLEEQAKHGGLGLWSKGLAILQTSFGSDRIPDLHVLEQAEQSAKSKKLKIWENFAEGEVVPSGANVEAKQKEVLKVTVTEVLGGGKFYVQTVGDQKIASIQNQLASLNLKEAPVIGAFNPKKGDIVLCYFRADTSWYRAMVVNTPRGPVKSPKDVFEVFCWRELFTIYQEQN